MFEVDSTHFKLADLFEPVGRHSSITSTVSLCGHGVICPWPLQPRRQASDTLDKDSAVELGCIMMEGSVDLDSG